MSALGFGQNCRIRTFYLGVCDFRRLLALADSAACQPNEVI
jgi:hypothetical protein